MIATEPLFPTTIAAVIGGFGLTLLALKRPLLSPFGAVLTALAAATVLALAADMVQPGMLDPLLTRASIVSAAAFEATKEALAWLWEAGKQIALQALEIARDYVAMLRRLIE